MSVDLSSTYLGMRLSSPIVAAACPLTGNIDVLKRFEAAGAGAAVLPSLFEEQIEFEECMFGGLMDYGANSFGEATTYFPEVDSYNTGPDEYLETIEKARDAVSIPVIGSLNGVSPGGWTRYAKLMEDAGASALELNMYQLVTDANITATQIEDQYIELVSSIRSTIQIPLAVKIGPYFSSLPNFARRLFEAGADGLVLFNRFFQPDVNIERMEIHPQMELSRRTEMRLPMRWIAILDPQVKGALAANSGIQTANDIFKMLLVGADVTMMAAAFVRHGPEHVAKLLADLQVLLAEHGYTSVDQFRGSFNHRNTPDPSAFERLNYMKALTTYVVDLP
ncbi:MAG: dihydroorotate dehydrogenase-like protein [Planctomycetaceae bacterium]|nr:dihydroorotate dehydrogenase-like protein [Planctomycetaceae bacterium]